MEENLSVCKVIVQEFLFDVKFKFQQQLVDGRRVASAVNLSFTFEEASLFSPIVYVQISSLSISQEYFKPFYKQYFPRQNHKRMFKYLSSLRVSVSYYEVISEREKNRTTNFTALSAFL